MRAGVSPSESAQQTHPQVSQCPHPSPLRQPARAQQSAETSSAVPGDEVGGWGAEPEPTRYALPFAPPTARRRSGVGSTCAMATAARSASEVLAPATCSSRCPVVCVGATVASARRERIDRRSRGRSRLWPRSSRRSRRFTVNTSNRTIQAQTGSQQDFADPNSGHRRDGRIWVVGAAPHSTRESPLVHPRP